MNLTPFARTFPTLLLVLGGALCPVNGAPQPQAAASPSIVTPYARKAPLEIRKVALSAPTVPRYGRLELTVDLSATFDNPFDPEDIAVDARVRMPSGQTLSVPGFWYRPYDRVLKGGREVFTAAGEPSWRIRFAPVEVGAHTLTVTVRTHSGSTESKPVQFTATAADAPGFLRISQRDRRYFAFDDGRAFFPLGANVCWGGGGGTFDYDTWFSRYADAGCNYARLWLSPHWTTFALERPGKRQEGHGMGQFDLANAWRLDHVLELATQRGLWLKLCIDSFNILREKTGYPQWENTPHNAAMGGPLQRPTDFWTNPAMEKFYRDKLRYLVARYGAFTHVFAWEFWNEVDIVTGYQTEPVRAWHERMARTLRALDPYRHLITTSFANTRGDPEIDRLPELDYVQSHHYGSPDLCLTIAQAQARKAAFGKPHYFGEIGADAGGARGKDDPMGLQIHDPIWVSVVTGGAGCAQPWWWDSVIQPNNLYPLFTSLAKLTAGIDWPAENFQTNALRVDWQTKPEPPPRQDLNLEAGPASWDKSEFNQPRTVRITRAGAQGQLPLAGIQHGLGGHRDKHNPVTFEIDLPWPTRFDVLAGDVSGYGGAALKLMLDGQVALTKDFADPDGSKDTKTLTQYTGAYGVDVPAGRHKVIVENTGRDWFMASYRFRNAVEAAGPPVLAWGLAGRTTALVWARVEGRTWQRVCALKETISPAPPTMLTLSGLSAGRWQAEVWDTWAGVIQARREVIVSGSGNGQVRLPQMERDLAVRLRKQ